MATTTVAAMATPGASCSSSARGCLVQEDVAKGWEGFCMGLQLLNRSVTQEACRSTCCNDPSCEEWVWASERTLRDPAGATTMSCYTGRGFECESIRTDIIPYAGQRISHGKKLPPGVWCTGNGMRKMPLSERMSHKERLDRCRSTCFFDKDCHVWQYSTLKGCWSGRSHQCFQDVSLAGTIMDSQEFVCSSMAGQAKTNYLMVFLVILSAAVLLLCFAIIVLFFGICGPKRPQTPRSPKSSRPNRQESTDDEEGGQELDQHPEDITPLTHGGMYRPLHPNSSPPSNLQSPAMSMNESLASSQGSMAPLVPGSPMPGGTPIRPVDQSFGGISSNSSFSGTAPLLGQPYPRTQPMSVQPDLSMARPPMGLVDPRFAGMVPPRR